jgi:hypothetical protein
MYSIKPIVYPLALILEFAIIVLMNAPLASVYPFEQRLDIGILGDFQQDADCCLHMPSLRSLEIITLKFIKITGIAEYATSRLPVCMMLLI